MQAVELSDRRKTHLREFQARLNDRLRQSTHTELDARLGLMIGERRYLVDLSEAGEIVPASISMTPVPLTQDWFCGLVNLRGVLFAVSDLSRFAGGPPTALERESRLLAFSARLNFNAALRVTRMAGLQNMGPMQPDESPSVAGRPPWLGDALIDAEGRRWTELSLARLAADERFGAIER